MICYRRMTPADLPAVAAIEATVLDGWSKETIALTLHCPTSHCFVAVEQSVPARLRRGNDPLAAVPSALPQGDSVYGFCACTLVADTCNLDAVSVAEESRRHGAGRGLVMHAMAMLCHAGAHCMWLEARSQNTSALALYASLGFVQNGHRQGFYQNPADDAVLMAAQLGAALSERAPDLRAEC